MLDWVLNTALLLQTLVQPLVFLNILLLLWQLSGFRFGKILFREIEKKW